jgi:hypoxanthine phosphoribosyltransferase
VVDVEEVKALQANSRCLHDKADIDAALDRMAADISKEYADKAPVFLCVMLGSLIPLAELVQRLNFPLQIDYIHVTRYQGKIRAGDLHWIAEPRMDLKDRHVVVVEDVLDGGLTLSSIVDYCKQVKVASVKTAVVVDKQRPREPGALEKADFVGLEVPNLFLYGYGMDYEGYLRNIPGIYAVNE